MTTKTFHAAKPPTTEHAATIDGYYLKGAKNEAGEPRGDDERWELELRFQPQCAFAELNKVMGSVGVVDGKLVANGLDMQAFLVSVATDHSRPVLEALVHDRDRAVDVQVLAGVAMWLIGVYSGRDDGDEDPGANPTTR